jgi:L-lysine exporter family protein LysE/ArgO
MDLSAAAAGFALGLSLIVAIGAQNAYVLRQGLRGEHVLTVVAICAASDATLIALGIAGMGALIAAAPGVLTAVRVAGAVFLLVYGAMAARRALNPGELDVDLARPGARPGGSWAASIATVLALTWLNPHVYLDTVLLLGSVARAHGNGVWFGIGAALASLVWFTSLGYGARLLRPLFARPFSWRVLDVLIAVVMITLALTLLF